MVRPAHPQHHHLPHHLQYFHHASLKNRFLALFLAAVTLTLLAIFFRSRFGFNVPSNASLGQVNLISLGLAASYTLVRLTMAYLISLPMAILLAVLTTTNRRVEGFMLPLLDVLQSVPVLAFFPVAVLAFAASGFLEGAAIFILSITMVWNIVFPIVVSVHSIPPDVKLAAENYGARGVKYLWNIVIPSIMPALVTGSILAWGQAWNITIVAEFINYGSVHEFLPGLGSTLDQAAASVGEGNTTLFIAALLTLVALVLVLNRLVWQPLINFSERFKFD